MYNMINITNSCKLHMKATKRVNPKCSHHKKKFFFYFFKFYLYEMMDVH